MKQLCFYRDLLFSSLNLRDNFIFLKHLEVSLAPFQVIVPCSIFLHVPPVSDLWLYAYRMKQSISASKLLSSSCIPCLNIIWTGRENRQVTAVPCQLQRIHLYLINSTSDKIILHVNITISAGVLLQYPCDNQGNFCKNSRDNTADSKGSQTWFSFFVCLLYSISFQSDLFHSQVISLIYCLKYTLSHFCLPSPVT